MDTLPADIPDIVPQLPVAGVMVAIAGLPLLHVPPGELGLRVALLPTLIIPGPTIAPATGIGFTDITAVRLQLLTQVYVIVEVPRP